MFLFCEPLQGQSWTSATEHRTKANWAQQIKDLIGVCYAAAERIRLVGALLNALTPAALYEVFSPAEAMRHADKLEMLDTPKHGSWLNIAEIELSLLSRQCLGGRVPGFTTLKTELAAWQQRRNAADTKVGWRLTTQDARIKLKRLYPSLQK